MQLIKEGEAKLRITPKKIVSKEMPIFYNPVMKFNRDISILILNSIDKNHLKIALPLSASGIRGIRFLLELKKNKIKEIHFNDYDKNFKKTIQSNLKLNKIKNNKIKIHNTEANLFLLQSTGFDYIDIDPFGTPNPFLESAIKRINREGILTVTATDTSALCGTYPKACKRKYWATPLRNELMHEIGLRILIRKIQLVAAQFEKALTPIFSYSKDHYMRVFLKCEKAKSKVDEILKQHNHFENIGPIWTGKLWDGKLVNKMHKNNKIGENEKILRIIKEESKINTIGFYDIHKIVKRNKIKKIPKKLQLIKKIKKLGYKASETHFNPEAIRSNIPLKKLLKLF
jgi:tRNA (guanine26-N2/guanine27-N2)-dimethyltransferase